MTNLLPKLGPKIGIAAFALAAVTFAASAPAQDTTLHGDTPAPGHHASGHAKGGWTHTATGHSNGHAKGGHGDGHGASGGGDGHSGDHAKGGHADRSSAAS